MRNHKKYRSIVINLFQSFLAGKITERELIDNLTEIENELKKGRNTSKELWFRFFKRDTMATSILNIYRALDSPNRESLIEDFQLSIDNPKELKIYFS